MRRIDPHSHTPYTRILKTRWGMLGYQLFLNVSVVCNIQYTVHHTSVSVSFTLLIKTFCTPPGGNSVPKPYLINLKVGGILEVCISKTTALKPNLWRRGWKKTGGEFCVGNFLVKGNNSLFMFLLVPSRENASPSPKKSVGIDIWYNGNRSDLKLQGIVLSWLCLYVFYPSGFKITFSTNGFFL